MARLRPMADFQYSCTSSRRRLLSKSFILKRLSKSFIYSEESINQCSEFRGLRVACVILANDIYQGGARASWRSQAAVTLVREARKRQRSDLGSTEVLGRFSALPLRSQQLSCMRLGPYCGLRHGASSYSPSPFLPLPRSLFAVRPHWHYPAGITAQAY